MLGCAQADRVFCEGGNCGWGDNELARIGALADLPEAPPPDRSNKYQGNPLAEQLGRKFFFDARFSGFSNGNDAISRPMPYARAPKGQPLNISCATCHNLRGGGGDPATVPGNVSIGAGWDALNASTVINDAFQPVILWAGRADSMWAQPVGSIEASMGSNRLRAGWTVASLYRADYEAVFTDWPMPMTGTIADVTPLLETTGPRAGQCLLSPACPSSCREVPDASGSGVTGCWPRFPLDGKPGAKAGCQPGDATEPYGDAWDCMAPEDQTAALRVLVNFAKAIGAFEFRLVSRNSAFDAFAADMRAGHATESTAISSDAKNGARLFVGKAGCADCHNTPLLSDSKFYNVGVPQTGQAIPTLADCPKGGVCDCVTPKNCLPWGAFDGNAKLRKNAYLRSSMWSDDPTDDSRKWYFDQAPESFPKGGYRTPGLRDVALTGPYMHDGLIGTLEEVVAHYNRGGEPVDTGDRSARIKPLYLSDQEQSQLVAFLRTLTGEPLPSDIADKPDLPK